MSECPECGAEMKPWQNSCSECSYEKKQDSLPWTEIKYGAAIVFVVLVYLVLRSLVVYTRDMPVS